MKIIVVLAVLAGVGAAHAQSVLRMKRFEQPITRDNQALHTLGFDGQPSDSGHLVVQFAAEITAAQMRALQDRGLHIQRYVPDNAVLVFSPSRSATQSLKLLPGVQGVSPYRPEWKISSRLDSADLRESVVVTISGIEMGATDGLQTELLKIDGVELLANTGRLIYLRTPKYLLPRIALVDGVEWIDAYREFKTMDFDVPEFAVSRRASPLSAEGNESGTRIMNFETAWKRGFTGQGQIVAMVDTGLDLGSLTSIHPDFLSAVIKGYPLGTFSRAWEDYHGHGTHVAGSIMGRGTASQGFIRGGAYEAKILVGGVMSPDGQFGVPSNPVKLFGTFQNEGARVHSNSWGADSEGEYDAFAAMVDRWAWDNQEMLLVFAAGNAGGDSDLNGVIDPSSVGSPGTAKNVLTVGASENYILNGGYQKTLGQIWAKSFPAEPYFSDRLSNNENGIAAFSSRGPTQDGRLKPDVVAPGTNIVSARSKSPTAKALWGVYDDNYLYCGGTSMATPLTSGAALVVRDYLAKERGLTTPSASLVKGVLMISAVDLFPGQFGTGPTQEIPRQRPNNVEGFGRVDVAQAIDLTDTLVVDEKVGVAANEEKTYEITVPEGKKGLSVLMVYNDAPGLPSSAKALVNDLDLRVLKDGARRVRNGQDRVNNSEFIEMKTTGAGVYRITVKGFRIVQGKNGKVPFSLVAKSL